MSLRRALLTILLLSGCPRAAGPPPPTVSPPPPRAERTLAPLGPASRAAGDQPGLPAAPLRVVDASPRGRTDGHEPILLRFNQPVVALGADAPADGILAFEPALTGRAAFREPDLLAFAPDPLTPATRYTVRLRAPVVALSGARLDPADAPALTFETPRPHITAAFPDPDPESPRYERGPDAGVLLQFDQPVPLAEVQRHVRAHVTGDPRALPVLVERATAAHLARLEQFIQQWPINQEGLVFSVWPKGRWPSASEITISVAAGVRGRGGPLPGDTPFRTRLRTYGPLRVERAPGAPPEGCERRQITLRFSTPITRPQLQRIQITPRPADLDIQLLDAWSAPAGGQEVTIDGGLLPGARYQVRVSAELTDAYGQRLGQDAVFSVPIERQPCVTLSEPAGTLAATGQRTLGVLTRHVRALSVRAVVLTDAELAALVLPPLVEAGAPGETQQDETQQDETQQDETQREVTPRDPTLSYRFPEDPQRVTARRYPLRPRGPTDWDSVTLDLGELGRGQRRPILIEAQATELVPAATGQPLPAPVRGLFRVTDLGPVAFLSGPGSVASVLRLSTGAPVAGVTVRQHFLGGAAPRLVGTTDARGLVPLPGLGAFTRPQAPSLLSFSLGDDHAFLPVGAAASLWQPPPLRPGLRPGEALVTQLLTERSLYLPGDRVRAVGWAAVDTPYARSGLRRIPAGLPVQLELRDARQQVVATASARTTAEGKFWAELPLSERPGLGHHTLVATLLGATAEASVRVGDVRVPAFSVRAALDRQDVRAGESARVQISASYYFGGPVPIGQGSWVQRCEAADYRMPGLGSEWLAGEVPAASRWRSSTGARQELAGGGAGRVELRSDPALIVAGVPNRCGISVSLTDGSEQWQGAAASFRVHPARRYLALRLPRDARPGTPALVYARAVAPSGAREAAAGATIEIDRVWSEPIYKTVDGAQVEVGTTERRELVRRCALDLPAAGPDPACAFTPTRAGDYAVRAGGLKQELAPIEARFWVTEPPPPRVARGPRAPGLELHLSRTVVAPGDPVEVQVRAPWREGRGLLVLWRNGLREHLPFALQGGVASFSLRADDTWTPRVSFTALVVYQDGRGQRAVAQASAEVSQGRGHRALQVSVEAPARAAPGGRAGVQVRVRGADGAPVRARVALWAVDEALLMLARHQLPDLLEVFQPTTAQPPHEVDEYDSLLAAYAPPEGDPWLTGRQVGRLRSRRAASPDVVPGTAEVRGGVRGRFETTPLFLGDVATDADGVARAEVALPDNLTTFRITAVASARLVDGDSPGRFGVGDARLTVTSALVLRAALPRLLRPGDHAEIAALANNLDGPAGTLQVQARVLPGGADSPLWLTSAAERSAPIAAGGLVRLPFQIAAGRPGAAQLELRAVLTPAGGGPVLRDALRLPLPVQVEPTARERVAVHGVLADGAAVEVPVALPTDAVPGQGALTVSASATLLGGLGDAARGLIDYPYGCAEQTASKLLPLAAVAELGQLGLAVPDVTALARAGFERLASMQVGSGGLSYWPGGAAPHVYASAYAGWVLALLQRAGHPAPAALLERLTGYLSQVVAQDEWRPDDVLEGSRRALVVHALVELGLAARGQAQEAVLTAALARLYEDRGRLPAFTRGFLLMALHRRAPADPRVALLTDELLASVVELAGSAHVVERRGYRLDSLFHSEARADAIVLLALLQVRPDHALVVSLARGLRERRVDGAWRNTQENAYGLMALAAYARAHERDAPDLMARVWAGPRQLLGARFQGRGAPAQAAALRLDEATGLARVFDGRRSAALRAIEDRGAGGLLPVVLQRQGQGRLYYRLGLEWTPRDPDHGAGEHGLALARCLRTAAGPAQEVRAGEPVALDITVRATGPLSYVVIDVPLPPGLEVLQQDLGQAAAQLRGTRGYWMSHLEGRRDRVLIFADDLAPGVHEHTVDLRATIPGRYAMPGAVASAMYAPEVYGRTTAAQVTVR